MKKIFKQITSSVFLVSLFAPLLFGILFFNFNVNTAMADCSVWTPGSDVWYAQGCDQVNNNSTNTSTNSGGGCNLITNPKFNNLVDYVICIINISVIPLILGLVLALFVYGVAQYVLNEADEGKREKGKQFMVWGIIALTVMLSVWGLVAILGGTFGLNTSIIPQAATN